MLLAALLWYIIADAGIALFFLHSEIQINNLGEKKWITMF